MATTRNLALEGRLAKSGYTFKKILGRGAYGRVDLYTNKKGAKVAIKTMKIDFDSLEDTKRLVREIYLLRQLKHPNICPLLEVIPPSDKNFDEISLVLKHKDTDLEKVINSEQALTDEHAAYFIYQILSGVNYLNEANVMHRDLKLSNILLDCNCTVQVCDFNLSKQSKSPVELKSESEVEPILAASDKERKGSSDTDSDTRYVVTRWYRAPEIILANICPLYGSTDYGLSSDMWSVGLILLKLLMRVGGLDTNFLQGDSSRHQLNLIFDLLGTEKDLKCIKNEAAREYLMKNSYFKLGNVGTLDVRLIILKSHIENINKKRNKEKLDLINMDTIDQGIDLLKKMLVIDPDKRISVQDALNHSFVGLYKYEDTLKPTFLSQLRNEKGQLTIAGASAVWLSQLERQSHITTEMLRAYFMNSDLFTETVTKVKTTTPEPITAVPVAQVATALPKAPFWQLPVATQTPARAETLPRP